MKEQLEKIEALAKQELASCTEIKALDDLRIKFLGKKGELTAILKQMGKLSAEERPVIGQLANKVRADIEEALGSKLASLKADAQAAKLAEEKIDITLPGKQAPFGKLHPLTKVENEIREIFIGMGFNIADGSEIDDDYHVFEALNLPPRSPCKRYSGYLLHRGHRRVCPPPYPDIFRSGARYGEPEAPYPYHLSRTSFPFRRR